MTKKTKAIIGLAAIYVSLAVTQGIRAEEGDSPHSFSGTATFTTDYVFRGVTQTLEDPAVQASLDYAHDSGVYVGVWGSSINFGGTEESVEVDFMPDTAAKLAPSATTYLVSITLTPAYPDRTILITWK